MKVIFLDHDGVICLSTEWGSRFKKQQKAGKKLSQSITSLPIAARFDNFNKKAIKTLNEILEKTEAEIVVSSDWKRWADVEELGEYYESQGIIKKPISITPNLGQCSWYIDTYPCGFPWNREWNSEMTRVIEIKQYLYDHPEITRWVSVDDLNMGKTGIQFNMEFEHDWALDNFVLTPLGSQGIKQSGIKDKIIGFLMN